MSYCLPKSVCLCMRACTCVCFIYPCPCACACARACAPTCVLACVWVCVIYAYVWVSQGNGLLEWIHCCMFILSEKQKPNIVPCIPPDNSTVSTVGATDSSNNAASFEFSRHLVGQYVWQGTLSSINVKISELDPIHPPVGNPLRRDEGRRHIVESHYWPR